MLEHVNLNFWSYVSVLKKLIMNFVATPVKSQGIFIKHE